MTINPNALLTSSQFCRLRDAFQRERQAVALPVLKARQVELKAQIAALAVKRGERFNVGLEDDIKELSFEAQYAHAQISVIEGL